VSESYCSQRAQCLRHSERLFSLFDRLYAVVTFTSSRELRHNDFIAFARRPRFLPARRSTTVLVSAVLCYGDVAGWLAVRHSHTPVLYQNG